MERVVADGGDRDTTPIVRWDRQRHAVARCGTTRHRCAVNREIESAGVGRCRHCKSW